DRSRLRRRLESRGDVHRVAERRVLDTRAGADLPDHDRSGSRADANTESLRTPAAAHLERILLHLPHDAQGAPDGPLGVVLARRGSTEEGEDTVAREILHVSAERLHLADDPRHRLTDHELHVL